MRDGLQRFTMVISEAIAGVWGGLVSQAKPALAKFGLVVGSLDRCGVTQLDAVDFDSSDKGSKLLLY